MAAPMATDNWPVLSATSSLSASRSSPSSGRVRCRMCQAYGVNATRRPLRSTSGLPNCACRLAMRLLTADCVIDSRRAAFDMVPHSASDTRASRLSIMLYSCMEWIVEKLFAPL